MGRILLLDPEKTDIPLKPEDKLVTSAADTIKQLNRESYELLIIRAERLSISVDALIRRALAKNPLMGVLLTGQLETHSKVGRTLIDLLLHGQPSPEHIIEEANRIIETRKLLSECDLVGKSPELIAIGELVCRVAPADLPVLVVGESGTGKELVARAIHNHSKRSSGPFLPVNAAAIPDGTLESELFGHEKGSFTGAYSKHGGYFEQADRGTIFLDEIAEIPVGIQAKLLRVLETGDIIRVGGSGAVHVDIRLICATNSDLTDLTSRGEFRQDLYYRLAAVKINIPPLRERPEDIPVLVFKFTRELKESYKNNFGGFSMEAIAAMMEYHWPGNVRELRNLVENALLLAGEKQVRPSDIRGYFEEHAQMGRKLPMAVPGPISNEHLGTALAVIFSELRQIREQIADLNNQIELENQSPEDVEKKRILQALRDNDFDKAATAAEIGISTRTLYRRLRKYGIRTG